MAKNNIGKFIDDLEDALDKGMGRFLQKTQGKLIKDAPVDSGRFASSWFIGQNAPNTSVATERPKGAGDVVQTPFPGKITAEGNWYITST
ncbi:MAG: HK97 gp10 family phage protein, partial [Planctomycetaceae bacterium]|nr:HK97 gp10 family phage protein [Planctomycetaceae bacterium]